MSKEFKEYETELENRINEIIDKQFKFTKICKKIKVARGNTVEYIDKSKADHYGNGDPGLESDELTLFGDPGRGVKQIKEYGLAPRLKKNNIEEILSLDEDLASAIIVQMNQDLVDEILVRTYPGNKYSGMIFFDGERGDPVKALQTGLRMLWENDRGTSVMNTYILMHPENLQTLRNKYKIKYVLNPDDVYIAEEGKKLKVSGVVFLSSTRIPAGKIIFVDTMAGYNIRHYERQRARVQISKVKYFNEHESVTKLDVIISIRFAFAVTDPRACAIVGVM